MSDKEWCKRNCPYQPDCMGEMCNYIISMAGELKPQKIKLEERKVLEDDSYDEPVYSIDKFFHCPRCNEILGRTNKDHNIHFCYNCGQAVEWE